MIDRDTKELLEFASELAALGSLVLEIARYAEAKAEERKKERPRNRIRHRKHKR